MRLECQATVQGGNGEFHQQGSEFGEFVIPLQQDCLAVGSDFAIVDIVGLTHEAALSSHRRSDALQGDLGECRRPEG